MQGQRAGSGPHGRGQTRTVGVRPARSGSDPHGRGQTRTLRVRPQLCGPEGCACARITHLHGSWISWAVVAGGAAVLWSCVGIDRTRRAALRRRLLLGAGIVVLGFASFAFTGSSSGTAAGARRVADAFTLARLTRGKAAAQSYLAPDAAPLAAQLPRRPSQTPAAARRIVAYGRLARVRADADHPIRARAASAASATTTARACSSGGTTGAGSWSASPCAEPTACVR